MQSAFLLSYLIDKEDYHRKEGTLIQIDDEKYFFATSKKIEEVTFFSYKVQKRCIKTLMKFELVSTKLISVPAKLHFTLKHDKILQMVMTSIALKDKLDSPKGEHIILKTDNQKQKPKTENTNRKSLSNFLKRKNDFINKCDDIDNSNEILDSIQFKAFIEYWTATNEGGWIMAWEKNKTFSIKQRMSTWKKNAEKWDKKKESKENDYSVRKNFDEVQDLINKKYASS